MFKRKRNKVCINRLLRKKFIFETHFNNIERERKLILIYTGTYIIYKIVTLIKSSAKCKSINAIRFLIAISFFSDPRTRDWFLIPSPIPGASIIIGYLYFVLSWGPKYMEHRKPYQLKNTLVVYNFLQIIISTWLFWEGLTGAWLNTSYDWRCEPVDFSYSPHALRVRK